MLKKMVLIFQSMDEILKCNHLNDAIEQYFPEVLFSMLCKVVLNFGPEDTILRCSHPNKSLGTTGTCTQCREAYSTVYYVTQVVCSF